MKDTVKGKCICISCFDFYETRMESIVSYFQNKGYDVTYVISDYQHYKKSYFRADYNNCIQVHVPSYKRNLSFARLFSHYIFSKKVYKILCEEKPSVIYSQFPPNYLTKVLNRYTTMYKASVILDCYDMWPESFPKKSFSLLLKPFFKYWASIRDRNIGFAKLILVVSQAHFDFVRSKWANQQIKILEPSVRAKNININCEIEETLSFCYLGNVNYITDVDLIVHTLGQLRRYKKVVLHIIGKGDNLNTLIEQLNAEGVETMCHGVVFDTDEKLKIYSLCSLGINMPKKEINSTMSLKSVEYLSVGLPFLNSAGGDSSMLVEKFNVGVNVSEKEMAESVSKILELDKDKLLEMHSNCTELYNSKFISRNLDEVFKDVL